ncbi:MAG: 3-isopropylmalate dehydratase small subunit [Allosphingosinicella sp.]
MEPFTFLAARAIPLIRDNVDTDAIIPSREMRTVSKSGLADGLFAGWRYREIGGRDRDPDFVLNDPQRAGAQILVSGANFGCGSSREHAVWALSEYGVRAIIAPSFNPIFYGNCIANGVLPITLPLDQVQIIGARSLERPTTIISIDLPRQEVSVDELTFHFVIEPEVKNALTDGLDPIEQTLQLSKQIETFRSVDAQHRPWIYEPVSRLIPIRRDNELEA